MHICFITHEYPANGLNHGGIGTFIQILGRGLVKEGHDVSVVGTNRTRMFEYEEDEGVQIHRIPRSGIKKFNWAFNAFQLNKRIRKIHKVKKIDFVESPEMSLAFISKISGIKYIIRMNGGHHFFAEAENKSTGIWRAFQEKRSFSKADEVCAVSNYVAETTRRLLHLGNRNIPILFNPANTTRFKKSSIQQVRSESVLFVGSICKKKGIEELVQAMPIVWKKFPNAILNIVGRDVYDSRYGGSFVEYLKSQITDFDRINFIGPVSNAEVAKFIEKAAICVYPSYMEALPLAWLEVLASGKPFVGSVTGPGPEVVKHKETGLLVNPRSPTAIAEAINLLFENPDLAKQLGEAAYIDVKERFDSKVMLKKNISYYQSLLK